MTSTGERQPWELAADTAESKAPVNPTNEPIEEEERGQLAASEDGEEPSQEEEADAGPMDDGEPPPERTHEEEGAVGAGSQYAAEDAEEDHSEPRGPAGAA